MTSTEYGSYFDKDGSPLSEAGWLEKLGDQYNRVAEDDCNGVWVSTVWLGLNHAYGSGPPVIFETMVFESKENLSELYCDRYHTLEEAEAGHLAVLTKIKNHVPRKDW